MGFYEQISKYYDCIFPAGREQLDFILQTAGPAPRRILDVACGSGGYTVKLAQAGYDVTGMDLDAAMIRMAADKVKEQGVSAAVIECNMLDIEQCFDRPFDCIFCIGNSIVHLGSQEDIGNSLRQMYSRLERGGALVLQIINYDRILKHNISHLPTLRDDTVGLEFVRRYDYEKAQGIVNFRTVLTVGTGDSREVYENSIELLPVLSGDLRRLLENAGFNDMEFFGDFRGTAYDEEAFLLVARAVK